MSGPITAGFFLLHGTLLLSARALAEARAMRREYADVLAQMGARELSLAQARAGQRNARLERIAAIRRDALQQAARFERLRALAGSLSASAPDIAARAAVAAPAAPADDSDAAWGDYLRRLQGAVAELEALLGEAGGAVGDQLRAALAAGAAAPTIDDVLGAYVLERQMKSGLDAREAERFRQTAARVLARLPLAEGASLPQKLESLARAIVLAPTLERAEALATELRLAVQLEREAQDAQQRDAAQARQMLAELPHDAPAPLLQALEAVAAGVARMDASLREAAEQTLATAAADREQQEQEAAALVLQESLRDLGYDVADIESTLFVDGGAVHFRRTGWDNYFVRLRVDAAERTVNFNVVRAKGDEENAERRRQDALAEDRWCTEFPRLMATLEARGLKLDVTRRLEAGEVPVQVVDGSKLPAIADEDATRPRAAPRAREQP